MKPVIVLALSNSTSEPLPNLKNESSRLVDILSKLHDDEILELWREESTTATELAKIFTRYNERICIFHYAGHAGDQELGLEGGDANVAGLAEYLSLQKGSLALVFLNGCSTKGQVEQLFQAGVKAVIATSEPIEDTKAVEFSEQFYDALSKNRTIEVSFNLAKAFLNLKYDESPVIEVYRGIGQKEAEAGKEIIPWGLFINPQYVESANWSFEAINKPVVQEQEEPKEGQVAYHIPNQMQVDEITECSVRISWDDIILEETEDGQAPKIESIQVSDQMEVSLLDVPGKNAFEIETFSTEKQKIPKNEVTEWIFFVKPKIEGPHTLYLKVIVIARVNDEDQKKDIVLNKKVEVLATGVEKKTEGKEAEKKESYYEAMLNFSFAPLGTAALPELDGVETPASKVKSGGGMLSKALIGTVGALVLATLIYFIWKPAGTPSQPSSGLQEMQEQEWEKTKNINTSEAFKSFIAEFPDSEYIPEAEKKIEEIKEKQEEDLFWQQNKSTPDGCQKYLDQYPEGQYKAEALQCANPGNFFSIAEEINGSIVDENNNPVSGAKIVYTHEGIKILTTNQSGEYILRLPANFPAPTIQLSVSKDTYISQDKIFKVDETTVLSPIILKKIREAPPVPTPTPTPTHSPPPPPPSIPLKIITDKASEKYFIKEMKDGRTWMTQNLNFNLGEGTWCYGNTAQNCENFGRLYNFEAAQKACDNIVGGGWRLPNAQEWKNLIEAYGSPGEAYQALKDKGSSYFNGQLGGYGYGSTFVGLRKEGYYWTSSRRGGFNAQIAYFDHTQEPNKVEVKALLKSSYYSCRCIKEE